MKKNSFLPSILLIGFGLYFLLEQFKIEIWSGMFTWSTFLIIIGLALLVQAYKQNDYPNILPGVVLFGVGLHFQVKNKFAFWPDHVSTIILIVGFGFLLRWQKTKQGLAEALILLFIASFFLFSNPIMEVFGLVEKGFNLIHTFWPALLIVIGVYLLFFKRK